MKGSFYFYSHILAAVSPRRAKLERTCNRFSPSSAGAPVERKHKVKMRSAVTAIKHSPTLLSWRSDSWRSDGRSDSFSNEHFKRRNQFKRLLFACLVRWAMTAALAAGTYIVLWQYSRKEAMVSNKKKEFNTLIIALSIALGLNIASSMKHMVRELRWWVLSWYEWTPKEVSNDRIVRQCKENGVLMIDGTGRLHFTKRKL